MGIKATANTKMIIHCFIVYVCVCVLADNYINISHDGIFVTCASAQRIYTLDEYTSQLLNIFIIQHKQITNNKTKNNATAEQQWLMDFIARSI